MSAGGSSGNIKFVAVARISDRATLASFVVAKGDANTEQYRNALEEVLNAPGEFGQVWQPPRRAAPRRVQVRDRR